MNLMILMLLFDFLNQLNYNFDNMYYSFDDNYTTHFSFDIQRRIMIFSFDYYYDDNLQKDVMNPCSLVIKDWTSIQYSLEPEDEYFELENSSVMPELALILEMKQEGNNLFLYAMSWATTSAVI